MREPDREGDAANSQRDRANHEEAQPCVGGRRKNLAQNLALGPEHKRPGFQRNLMREVPGNADGTVAVPGR